MSVHARSGFPRRSEHPLMAKPDTCRSRVQIEVRRLALLTLLIFSFCAVMWGCEEKFFSRATIKVIRTIQRGDRRVTAKT
jgi:hypothetical protein